MVDRALATNLRNLLGGERAVPAPRPGDRPECDLSQHLHTESDFAAADAQAEVAVVSNDRAAGGAHPLAV